MRGSAGNKQWGRTAGRQPNCCSIQPDSNRECGVGELSQQVGLIRVNVGQRRGNAAQAVVTPHAVKRPVVTEGHGDLQGCRQIWDHISFLGAHAKEEVQWRNISNVAGG